METETVQRLTELRDTFALLAVTVRYGFDLAAVVIGYVVARGTL